MTNNMKTFFQNCFQRIPISMDIRLPVFNGFLEHFVIMGFYYIVKSAKEFYYSVLLAHLKNAFNQVQGSMVNKAFDYSQLWREKAGFPFRQKIDAQQNYPRAMLTITKNVNKQPQNLYSDLCVKLIFSNFNNQKRFQSTKNYKLF